MLYATGQIRAQVTLGILFMASSIVVCYFVLMPTTALIPGFGLESVGLAGKMVVMQFIGVNATAIYLAKSMRIKFDWAYQPISGLGCVAAGWFAFEFAKHCIEDAATHLVQQMLFSGAVYLLLLFAFAWFTPSMLGVSRHELISLAGRIYPRPSPGRY